MNKSGADDGIQTELFQILKGNVVKVLQIWKTQKGPQDWKRFIFFPIPKKGKAKECSNYHTTAFISHADRLMLKIQHHIKKIIHHD